jgi:hypothetical protein
MVFLKTGFLATYRYFFPNEKKNPCSRPTMSAITNTWRIMANVSYAGAWTHGGMLS